MAASVAEALESALRSKPVCLGCGAELDEPHTWCNHAKGSIIEAPAYQDAWLKVARAIVHREAFTWFEPVPDGIIKEAERLVQRGFRIKRRVARPRVGAVEVEVSGFPASE